jgi:microcystin-dependent protein
MNYMNGTNIAAAVKVDPATGAVTISSGTPLTYGAQAVLIGGFWNVWMTFANDGTGNTVLRIRVHPTDQNVPSATGSAVFDWCQVENASAPTSRIFTTTSAVTVTDYVSAAGVATLAIAPALASILYGISPDAAANVLPNTVTVGNGTTETILILNSKSDNSDEIWGMKSGVLRWAMSLGDYNQETGSDAGSSFNIRAKNDAGGAIDTPLTIIRAAGGPIIFSATRPVSVAGGDVWSTGDVKLSFATSRTGWVRLNDGTIGDASSGATTRASSDTANLFVLLWTNVSDTYCAVSGGRGASAASDYAAHKTLALPKVLGRALASAGAGSGLTSRALAQTYGVETVQLTSTTMPSHTHTQDSHNHTQDAHQHYEPYYSCAGSGSIWSLTFWTTSRNLSSVVTDVFTGSTTATNQAATATNQNTGGGGYHENMPPEVFMNVFIKL